MKQKPQLDPRAVKLLRLVIEQLKRQPTSYDQNEPGRREKPTCQAPACIVGWMLYFRMRFWRKNKKRAFQKKFHNVESYSKDLFLTDEQMHRLYWPDRWPIEMQTRVDYWQYTAKEGIARIRRFIRTDGRE